MSKMFGVLKEAAVLVHEGATLTAAGRQDT